ncbi:hypothetical protein CTAYLR_004938 [Chrysophaeum taylorii]|uniref:G-patch domain-containing protein n=1 Tax=Chrysophaeum taylorii TaxID=2483200 RepID=A0AAD7UPG1_9STRA|nr:hypothetical protein CTAYLR_004938 [Chrysophaeum taylorii]
MAAAAEFYANLAGRPQKRARKGRYWCRLCGPHDDSPGAHEASLAHTLGRNLKPRTRRILLPDGNVGARILAKMGWADDGERPGLGKPGREGRVHPINLPIKQDTAGLGAEKKRPAKRGGVVVLQKPKETPPVDRTRRLRRELYGKEIPEGFEALFFEDD